MKQANTAITTLPVHFAETLPPEVLAAYSLDETAQIRKLGSGMVNATFLTEDADRKLVLQKLSLSFSPDLIEDYRVVAAHLQDAGWEMPEIIPSCSGRLIQNDDAGNLWRAVTYLESDAAEELHTMQLQEPQAYGRLLGKLHTSLSTLNYAPRFRLPHFHDTAYYAEQLAAAIPDIPSCTGQRFGAVLLRTLDRLPPLPTSNTQLIHGDPRTANILHSHGIPFTFIDWDTLMEGNPWLDIGDMLRSVAEDAVLEDRPVPISTITEIAEGYRQVACPDIEPAAFKNNSLLAAQTIALELAMRFVTDYKDGDEGYFAWDTLHYSSRHAYTVDRATYQMGILRQIENYKQEKIHD